MRVIAISLLACAASGALAQTNTAVRQLSLDDCIAMTMQQNVELQIERYNPQIADFALRAAYGAYDPTLSFSGEHDYKTAGLTRGNSFSAGVDPTLTPWGMTYGLSGSVFDDYGFGASTNGFNSAGKAGLLVTQPLLKNFWIDTARLTIKFNKNLLKRSELVLKQQTMEIITKLEQSFYALISFRSNVEVKRKAVDLAEQLAAENRKRVEVGAMAPLDARQAESQAATARADLIEAISLVAVQENLLKQLVSSNYAVWAEVSLVPSGSLSAPARTFVLQDSWRTGLATRPEILQAKLDAERAGIRLKYDYNQLFPQLDLFATFGYNGAGNEFSGALYDIQERNNPYHSYGGQISIPLANASARNNYKSSKVTLQQAALEVKRWERDIMKQVDDDIKLAQSSFERVAATRIASEYAEEALAAEQKKLEQGKSTTYTVLQLQRDLTDARGQEILALYTYNKNLSQLSRDEGTTLDRLGIRFEVK